MRGRSDPGRGSGPARYPGSFLLAFGEAAGRAGWEFLRLAGDMAVCRVKDGQELQVGMENLYRRARRMTREEWPGLLDEFFGTLRAVEEEPDLPVNLADVTDRLLVRVGLPMR